MENKEQGNTIENPIRVYYNENSEEYIFDKPDFESGELVDLSYANGLQETIEQLIHRVQTADSVIESHWNKILSLESQNKELQEENKRLHQELDLVAENANIKGRLNTDLQSLLDRQNELMVNILQALINIQKCSRISLAVNIAANAIQQHNKLIAEFKNLKG